MNPSTDYGNNPEREQGRKDRLEDAAHRAEIKLNLDRANKSRMTLDRVIDILHAGGLSYDDMIDLVRGVSTGGLEEAAMDAFEVGADVEGF